MNILNQSKYVKDAALTILSVMTIATSAISSAEASEERRNGAVGVCHLDKNNNYELVYENTGRALHHLEFHLSETDSTAGRRSSSIELQAAPPLSSRSAALASSRGLGDASPALDPAAIQLGDKLAVNGQCPQKYKVGDIGPAGGTVFYVTQAGFSGLEAVPPTQVEVRAWGCKDQFLGASTADGVYNTSRITNNCGANSAADFAVNTTVDGVTFNWYLPTSDELHHFADAISSYSVQGYKLETYWSSTETGSQTALAVDIWLKENINKAKNDGAFVLPIHQFSWFNQAGSLLP